jgi:CopG-like RHH_1 or ribbon-helix-helix domain, RHH_5
MTQRIYASVSDELSAWLISEAEANGRTLSNQIAWLLEQARKGES